MIKISIISGSNRVNSQSLRISKICLQKLKTKKVGIDLINLAKEKLPFWEEDLGENISPHKKSFQKKNRKNFFLLFQILNFLEKVKL